jgi:putative SOS response-associated peptidase YedK
MCGRSTLHDAPTNMLERFSLPPMLPGFVPRYNICPSQQQWTISRTRSGEAVVRQLRWGLIPSWANDPSIGQRMINARAESLTEKPSWSTPLRTQRCLVLADGYYEWKGVGKGKVPYYFRLGDGRAFGLAGLWDRWGRGDEPVETCTVITTAAGARTSLYHDRMPVVLTEEAATAWLDRAASPAELKSLMVAYESDDLEILEVSRYVNDPAHDSAECIQRVDDGVATISRR